MIRPGAALRRAYRLPATISLLLGGLATVLFVFPLISPLARDRTMAAWSKMLLAACGVRAALQVAAGSPEPALRSGGRMITANHVSWLDIFVIDAVAPSRFIAKADIARWPLIGTLVARVGTIFLERGNRHAVHHALHRVADMLAGGQRIAIFPEGTTGDGSALLPFHANLIQAAVHAKVPIDPVGLRYTDLDGRVLSGPGGVIDFSGSITFVDSMWRIIGFRGVIAEVHWLEPLAPDADPTGRSRHARASAARQSISQRLALPMQDTLPETIRDLRAGSQ